MSSLPENVLSLLVKRRVLVHTHTHTHTHKQVLLLGLESQNYVLGLQQHFLNYANQRESFSLVFFLVYEGIS